MQNCIIISDTHALSYKDGELYWKAAPKGSHGVGSRAGYKVPNGYRRITINKVKAYEHRFIWEYFNGKIPEGMQIDHINGVRDDNRIENLRLVYARGNANNRKDNNLFPGVIDRGNGYYEACIWSEGKSLYGGRYKSFGDALASRLLLEESICAKYVNHK